MGNPGLGEWDYVKIMRNHLTAKQRDYGIDLLRILSMGMILTLHVLGHGGVLKSTKVLSAEYNAAWLMETAAYSAVNCYGLISGYVGVPSRFKISNLTQLWLQVLAYSVGITGIFAVVSPEKVSVMALGHSLFPVSTGVYWYFTAYFPLSLVSPGLNRLLNSQSKRENGILIGMGVVLLSILPTVFNRDIFLTNGGYSFLWLALLYCLGGYFRKYGLPVNGRRRLAICAYAGCVLTTWAGRLLLLRCQGGQYVKMLYSYTSPVMLFAAIALLSAFAGWQLPKRVEKMVGRLAPLSFGVYLIHDHPLIRKNLMAGRFAHWGAGGIWKLTGGVFLAIIGIYLLCTGIDYIRTQVFRLLQVRRLCNWLERKLCGIGNRWFPESEKT